MSLVRVFEIPPSSNDCSHGGGIPAHFLEVDWFRDDKVDRFTTGDEGRRQIEVFIRGKGYYKPGQAYLILHPTNSFTMGYPAP